MWFQMSDMILKDQGQYSNLTKHNQIIDSVKDMLRYDMILCYNHVYTFVYI